MHQDRPLRIGIMGFGQIGRQLYGLAADSEDIDVVAIADIGAPDILHYLLTSEMEQPDRFTLDGNFLVAPRFRSRMMRTDSPAETPWDAFGVDIVIEATNKYRTRNFMEDHLRNGAPRVVLRSLPIDYIDRIVIPGVNQDQASVEDRMISGGSATTTALALMLKILSAEFTIEYASMTSVHAYSSDQSLQDYAGSDFRRSRSAAENIIPNTHEAGTWLGQLLPEFEGKLMTSALNVPIQKGSMLDLNLVLSDKEVTAEQINDVMRNSRASYPGIVDVVEDPIVSSDVIGNAHSLLFDTKATIKAGESIVKTLAWHETLGHAARLLDIARLYADLDTAAETAR